MKTKNRIAIVTAMKSEIKIFLNYLENLKDESFGTMQFFSGSLSEKECIVAVGGEGKVCAAACTQTIILKFDPCAIINVGTAGILEGASLKIGDVVVVDSCVQHDVDITALGHKRGMIPHLGAEEFFCNRELLKYLGCKKVRAATGDKFVADRLSKEKIAKIFGANICDMECASVAQVCYMNNIPFVALKKISDDADENAKDNYKNNKFNADKGISDLLVELIKKIN